MNRLIFAVCTLIVTGMLYAEPNLVQNGDFSDSGSTAPWNLDANGAQVSAAIDVGRYVISIQTAGTRETAPQLSQRGIELTPGEGYTLSFKVSASDTGYIRAFVAGEGNTVYSDSASGRFPVTTTGTGYSLDFFVQHTGGNARVVFNCGLSPHLTRIAFDSISLVKKITPIIRITAPSPDVRWISGTERQVEWLNSGTLNQVKLTYTLDSGATWKTITEVASNQNSFWWNIPVSDTGTHCRIAVSDTAGIYTDTSGYFSIVATGSVDAREMVKNGDFLDTIDWRFSAVSPARASGSITGDEFVMTIDTIGGEPWQVKLEQPGFTLENGTMYRFSFDAWSSHDRPIYANVGGDNGSPAWSVFGGDTIPVNITTKKTRYYQTIIMKYPTSSNIRVEFNCGNDTGTVYIDNVSLIRLETDDVLIFNPSLGSVLKSGSRCNIEWHAADVAQVNLAYSLDSGKTWVAIQEKIDNLGAFAWTVPDQSSEECFIRISDGAVDSVIGTSAVFQINKFGAPVKTGELIVNGTFTNSMQNWNMSFDGAQGSTETSDQMFKFTVNQPGASLGTIILSQTGLPVLAEKEYSLSFDAFANGTRSMKIVITGEEDSVTFLDTTVDLPAAQKKLSFSFTAEEEAITRVEFHIGGSKAGVFIDNVSFYTGPDPSSGAVTAARTVPVFRFTARQYADGVAFSCFDVNARIEIYNLKGTLVQTLSAAAGTVLWNGRTAAGSSAARGSYIAMLRGASLRQVRRFILK